MPDNADNSTMILLSVAFGIIIGVIVGYLFFLAYTPKAEVPESATGLTDDRVIEITEGYINGNLLPPGMTVTVDAVTRKADMYELGISVESGGAKQNGVVYVTLDGALLFLNSQPINMSEPVIREWTEKGVPRLKEYASELGLDSARFDECLDADRYAQEVIKDMQEGEHFGVQGTPAFFINGEMISGAASYTVFKAAIEKALAKDEPYDSTGIADDDPWKGDPDARVVIVEFSDFQCPYCAAFYGSNEQLIAQFKQRDPAWQPGYPNILKEYVDTGRVKFVYRDFPLDNHVYAQKAAEAAECADEQGRFWDYHDMLFERQS